jgi:hypothetical protein
LTEHEIEDDLIDEVVETSALNTLDPEEVERLTSKQRQFLIAFIGGASIPQARKLAHITSTTWSNWKADPQFQKVFEMVRNPAVFASALSTAIIFKAMINLYSMLDDDKTSVRQWAIERAFSLRPKEVEQRDQGLLSNQELKALVDALRGSDPQIAQHIKSQPFAFIEGEVREVPMLSEGDSAAQP